MRIPEYPPQPDLSRQPHLPPMQLSPPPLPLEATAFTPHRRPDVNEALEGPAARLRGTRFVDMGRTPTAAETQPDRVRIGDTLDAGERLFPRSDPPMERLTAISREDSDDPSVASTRAETGPPRDRPVVSQVEAATRSGEMSEFIAVRDGSRDVGHYVTRSLEPDHPLMAKLDTRPNAETRDETAEPVTNSDQAKELTVKDLKEFEQQLVWARIEERVELPDPKQQQEPPMQESELRIPELADSTDDDFMIVVRGTPLEGPNREVLSAQLSAKIHNLSVRPGTENDVAKFSALATDLNGDKGGTVLRRDILVGARDIDALRRVANTLVGCGLQSDGVTTFTIEEAAGRIAQYETKAAALAAPPFEDAYMPAARFADLIRYSETHGLATAMTDLFPPNYIPPEPGEPQVSIGRLVIGRDRYGREIYGPDVRVVVDALARQFQIIGNTGSGKTEAIYQIITSLQKAFDEQDLADDAAGRPRTPRTILVIDGAKIGNQYELAERLGGAGLSPERTTVHVAGPRKGGIWINFNPLQGDAQDPLADMQVEASVAISQTVDHAEAQRPLGKFMLMALDYTLRHRCGDLLPDDDEIRIAIQWVINHTKYQASTQADVGGYILTEYGETYAGMAKTTISNGYVYRPKTVLDNRGVTYVPLGDIKNPATKTMITTFILDETIAELRRRHPKGDLHHTELFIIVDEVGGLLDPEKAGGKRIGGLWREARGYGVSLNIGYQGNLERISKDAHVNTTTTLALGSSFPSDLKSLSERMGVSPDRITFLTRAIAGQGIFFNPEYTPHGATRIRTYDPRNIPRGKPLIVGPEAVVDLGLDPRFYDGQDKIKAKQLLLGEGIGDQYVGNKLRLLGDWNMVLTLAGFAPIELGGNLKRALEHRRQEHTAKIEAALAAGEEVDPDKPSIEEVATSLSADKAIRSRPLCTMVAPDPRTYARHIGGFMRHETVGAAPPSGPRLRPDLAFDHYKYNAVIGALTAHVTAGPLPEIAKYERALGEPIEGYDAAQQIANVDRLAADALTRVATAVVRVGTLGGGQQPDESIVADAVRDLSKFLSCPPDDRGKLVGLIYEKRLGRGLTPEETANISKQATVGQAMLLIGSRLARGLSPDEHAFVEELVVRMPEDVVGFAAARKALEDSIALCRKNAKALDLTKALGLSEDEIVQQYGSNFASPNNLATEQIKTAQDLQADLIATSKYAREMPRREMDIFYAPEKLDSDRCGVVLDNIVMRILEGRIQSGHFKEMLEDSLNQGKFVSGDRLSLVGLLARSDQDLISEWQQALSELIFEPNSPDDPDFVFPPGAREFLATKIQEANMALFARVETERARLAAQSAQQGSQSGQNEQQQ